MQRWQRNTGRLVSGVATVSLLAGLNGAIASATTSRLQLDIASKICVIDVVQDGGSETVQAPSSECESMLPQLLTTISGNVPKFALPFTGVPASEPIVVQGTLGLPWSPLTSTEVAKPTAQPAAGLAITMATGIGATVAVTLVGIDVAIFESQYSLRAGRWIRSRLIRP